MADPQHIAEAIPSSQKSKVDTENYSAIELTETEISSALARAKREKSIRIKEEEYWKTVKEPVYPKYDVEMLKSFALSKKKDFVKDEISEPLLNMLACYFSGDKFFEQGDLTFKKGLALFGGVGVGKTTLMEMFIENHIQSYTVIPCKKISNRYQEDGAEYLEKYYSPTKIAEGGNRFGHKELGFCFDDLGTETIPAKYFGNDKNVMAELLLERYTNRNIPFNQTHLTTNLTVAEIEQRYGTRFRDRMREMFNMIEFPVEAKSRR